MPTRIEIKLKVHTTIKNEVREVDLGPYIRAITNALENQTDFKVWKLKAERVETVSFPINVRRKSNDES